ncbi:MAG TPA: cytochrome P450 [Acidimicrobiia bacterium]|jgi:cytochrome P450
MTEPVVFDVDNDDYDPFEAFDRAQGAETVADPHTGFAALLSRCPVHQGSAGELMGIDNAISLDMLESGPTYTVFSYSGVEQVLRDHETFSSSAYANSMGLVMGHTILEMDEPEHGRYRRLIQQAFTRKEMERWEHELVRPTVNASIDAFEERGRADLVKELAFSFPNQVIAQAMGLPEADRPQFYRWAVEITNMASVPERGFAASVALGEYFGRLAAERRDAPGTDLISLLTQCELDGQRLTDEEIFAFLRLLLPAGSETTYRSSSNLLYGLLTHPDQLDALRADRSLMAGAIEEGLRWEPPLTGIARTAVRDVEIDGVHVPAGASIGVCLGAANRDPERFENPEDFDIRRTQINHLAFASGPHMCLGMHLARMETAVMLEIVLDRLPNLRLDPDADANPIMGFTFRAPRTLPVVFG